MAWWRSKKFKIWLVSGLILGCLGLFIVIGQSPAPSPQPAETEDSGSLSDEDQGVVVKVPASDNRSPDPSTPAMADQQVAEALETLQVDCRPASATDEVPSIEVNEQLTEVYDCYYQGRLYRRYLRTEFTAALWALLAVR